jgi:hypothetical protein
VIFRQLEPEKTRSPNMKKLLFFSIVAALLLIPCAAAYASDDTQADGNAINIEPADPTLAPSIKVFGNAIGGVNAGDLFIVDMSGIMADTEFILSITNTDELVHSYRYLTLNVGIYVQTDAGAWEKVTTVTGATLPDIYITMQSSLATFTLTGNARYKITIDKGCFHSYCVVKGESAAIPSFYLTMS